MNGLCATITTGCGGTYSKAEQLKFVHVLQQGMTPESVSTSWKEAAYLNLKRIDRVGVKVAKTLAARDYKGFGTGFDTMNGVLEIDT